MKQCELRPNIFIVDDNEYKKQKKYEIILKSENHYLV